MTVVQHVKNICIYSLVVATGTRKAHSAYIVSINMNYMCKNLTARPTKAVLLA